MHLESPVIDRGARTDSRSPLPWNRRRRESSTFKTSTYNSLSASAESTGMAAGVTPMALSLARYRRSIGEKDKKIGISVLDRSEENRLPSPQSVRIPDSATSPPQDGTAKIGVTRWCCIEWLPHRALESSPFRSLGVGTGETTSRGRGLSQRTSEFVGLQVHFHDRSTSVPFLLSKGRARSDCIRLRTGLSIPTGYPLSK